MYILIEEPVMQELVRRMSRAIYIRLQETGAMQFPLKKTLKYRFGDYKHVDPY